METKTLIALTAHEQSKLAFYNLYSKESPKEEYVQKLFDNVGSLDYNKGQEYALKMSEGEAKANVFLLWGNMIGGVKSGKIDPKEYFLNYITNEAGTIAIDGQNIKQSLGLLDLYSKQIVEHLLQASKEEEEKKIQMNMLHAYFKETIKQFSSSHLRVTSGKKDAFIPSRGLGMIDTNRPGAHNLNLVMRSLFTSIKAHDINIYPTFRDERNHNIAKYLFYIKTLNQLKKAYPENHIKVMPIQEAEKKIKALILEVKEDIYITNLLYIKIKDLKLQLERQLLKTQKEITPDPHSDINIKEHSQHPNDITDYVNTANEIISQETMQMKKILYVFQAISIFKRNLGQKCLHDKTSHQEKIEPKNILPIKPEGPPSTARLWRAKTTLNNRKICHPCPPQRRTAC